MNVALLAGGTSGERDISIESGKGALQALQEAGFNVTVFDPAKKDDLKALIDGNFDVAFLCTHGRFGEDGTLQGFLELIGLPYTGPGVWSSATSINKTISKVVYKHANIPTPSSISLTSRHQYSNEHIIAAVGEHCVVKPDTEGSTLGITIITKASELDAALDEAFKHDRTVIAESFVSGTELTVAVIGNDDPIALPVIEIVPSHSFYDFESKYAPGGSKHICPAPLSEEQTKLVQDLALQSHKALQCSGMSRTDIIIDGMTAWVLETNTVPGMTATSLLPDAGAAAGISFPELCTKLIGYALEK
jgi:D-alanine-D-alanine ligase